MARSILGKRALPYAVALAALTGNAVPAGTNEARSFTTQTNAPSNAPVSAEEFGHFQASVTRAINELFWCQRLANIATIDKVRFTGPPPRSFQNPNPPAGSNEVIVSALAFLPRQAREKKLPLIVFAHGEVHGNTVSDEDVHVVEELVRRGYAVIAPDYRGSSGYGADYWKRIDYGGREIDDVHAARQHMLDTHGNLDKMRVGIVGWSHGGLIALMTVFAHPNDYQACYAGAPVSDLELRVQNRGKDYEALFSAPYHIGKTVAEAPEEYRRRSPAFNAAGLQTPLLLQANTSDEDVPFSEVQQLISALRAANRVFSLHVYTNAPGGHYFNRLDTPDALASRGEIWGFLDAHLRPKR
jgi:dipeptidyl aminopeptidase/acylaminoacyl peptidase